MKLPLRKYLFFLATIISSLSGISQTINYTVFPAPYIFGQTNALAEDTLNNILNYQYSCNCGVGPANQWNTLNYFNLNNGLPGTPFYYGAYGVRIRSKSMHAHNNKVYVNDEDVIVSRSIPTYSPQNWSYNLTAPEKIISSAQRNDSIFIIKDDGYYCQTLQILNANTGTAIPYNSIECSTLVNGQLYGDIQASKISGNTLYLVGAFYYMDQFSNVIDTNAIAINISTGAVLPLHYGTNDTIKDIEVYNGQIYIAGNFTQARGQSRQHFASFSASNNLITGTPSFNGIVEEIEVYDCYLFAIGKYSTINGNVVNPFGNFICKAVNLNTNTIMNWNFNYSSLYNTNDEFILENSRNRLYMVSRQTSGANIDAYCLPPIKSTSIITTATTTICENSIVSFSVPSFQYASSYTWWYTGSGVSGGGTSNNVNFTFGTGATSGKLKMVANSACGGISDTLSVSITVNPRPGAIASMVDDTLNCFKPKVPILGNSSTSGVSYLWTGPAGYMSSQQNDSTGKYLAGNYFLTVTNTVTGCTSNAMLNFKLDTVKPNVTVPLAPYIIPCNPNSLLLSGTSTTTPTLLQWKNVSSSVYNANPYSATAPGSYVLFVQNTYNGCIDSDTIQVVNSTAQPTVTLLTYPSYSNFSVPADTITCSKSSVTISAAFSPTNCTIQWKDKATNQLYANPITVTGQGNYFPIVTRMDNNCVDSSKIVLIAQDIIAPSVTLLTPSPNINCSSSTATLNAVSTPSNCVGQWSGPSSFSSLNPAITSIQGNYYFTVTNPANGCVKKDSVNVGYANTLVINAGNDTVVCKNSPVNLNAVVMGTVSGLSYNWSNGGNSQSITVSAAVTTNYIVNVSGSGCFGSDTVGVIIPTDIQDSIIVSKGCTGNSGNLVVYATGGIPPYQFSVNGSTFSSANTFTNLAFGNYSVDIRDSIGCVLNSSVIINQSSNSVSANFIASTQNFKGDTVVFVDITSPKADSIGWLLPSVAAIIGGDMYSPIVVFADTGNFVITMEAYYSNCMISTTKTIRIVPFDSAYATLINNNGIKTLNVYPNPNAGVFTVEVEFYKKQNASIQLWDATSVKMYQQNYLDVLSILENINLPTLQNGTYILRVIGEYSSKYFNIIISK